MREGESRGAHTHKELGGRGRRKEGKEGMGREEAGEWVPEGEDGGRHEGSGERQRKGIFFHGGWTREERETGLPKVSGRERKGLSVAGCHLQSGSLPEQLCLCSLEKKLGFCQKGRLASQRGGVGERKEGTAKFLYSGKVFLSKIPALEENV